MSFDLFLFRPDVSLLSSQFWNGHHINLWLICVQLGILSEEKVSLLELWELRRQQYEQCMDLQLFYRDTEQVDNWMSKQEVRDQFVQYVWIVTFSQRCNIHSMGWNVQSFLLKGFPSEWRSWRLSRQRWSTSEETRRLREIPQCPGGEDHCRKPYISLKTSSHPIIFS